MFDISWTKPSDVLKPCSPGGSYLLAGCPCQDVTGPGTQHNFQIYMGDNMHQFKDKLAAACKATGADPMPKGYPKGWIDFSKGYPACFGFLRSWPHPTWSQPWGVSRGSKQIVQGTSANGWPVVRVERHGPKSSALSQKPCMTQGNFQYVSLLLLFAFLEMLPLNPLNLLNPLPLALSSIFHFASIFHSSGPPGRGSGGNQSQEEVATGGCGEGYATRLAMCQHLLARHRAP